MKGTEDQRRDDRGSYDVVGRQEAVAQGERGPKAVPGPSIELIPSTSESQGAVSETHDTKEERANGRPTMGRRDPTPHARQQREGLANTSPMRPEDRPFWAAERERQNVDSGRQGRAHCHNESDFQGSINQRHV